MPIFAPFGFMEQKDEVVPAWTPASFTNAQYWWRADLGVTESAGKVTTWEDQINSYQLIQNFSTNPSYTAAERRPSSSTSSNLNSQDTILFETSANATYGTVGNYLYGSTTPASNTAGDDVHFLCVIDYISSPASNAGGPFIGASGVVGSRIWIDRFNSGGDYRVINELGGGGAKVHDTGVSVATGAEAVWFYYDASNGNTRYAINSTTTSTATTGNGTNGQLSSSPISVGALLANASGGANLRFEDFHMAEAVVLYGTPTTEDLSNWTSYVNNRYGTIIS